MGDDFSIEDNAKLTTVSGFSSLSTIIGSLNIGGNFGDGNPMLTTLPSFSSLTRINGSLRVIQNDLLSSCCSFLPFVDGTVDPGGSISISGNAEGCRSAREIETSCTVSAGLTIQTDEDVPENVAILKRITGTLTIGGTITEFPNFASLEVVEEDLIIESITTGTLTSLEGIFPLLTEVKGNLIVRSHTVVETLSGFPELSSIGGNLDITGNASLSTVSGFGFLTSFTGDLTVSSNVALSSCCGLLRLVDGTVTPANTTFTPAAGSTVTGCRNAAEVKTACSFPSYTGGNLVINADTDVPSNVAGIPRITGDLTLRGRITTSPNFASLVVVEGDLVIRNLTTPALMALEELFPTLDSIRGSLEIQNHTVVATITGFAALDSIGGDLRVNNNTLLTSFPSFGALKGTGGDILLVDNAKLSTISGFGSLQSIIGTIDINRNTLLGSVSGFGSLNRLEGSLNIIDNAALTTLPTFPLLTRIDGALYIDENINLTSFSGFGFSYADWRRFLYF